MQGGPLKGQDTVQARKHQQLPSLIVANEMPFKAMKWTVA
jgi:hypothetical protein